MLQADIILMCANAKVYNHQNTKPHKEADVIFKYSVKYVSSLAKIACRLLQCLFCCRHYWLSCIKASNVCSCGQAQRISLETLMDSLSFSWGLFC